LGDAHFAAPEHDHLNCPVSCTTCAKFGRTYREFVSSVFILSISIPFAIFTPHDDSELILRKEKVTEKLADTDAFRDSQAFLPTDPEPTNLEHLKES